jgi:hypothetical protein
MAIGAAIADDALADGLNLHSRAEPQVVVGSQFADMGFADMGLPVHDGPHDPRIPIDADILADDGIPYLRPLRCQGEVFFMKPAVAVHRLWRSYRLSFTYTAFIN